VLKKTITYTGFDDQEYTEDFYFHLSKAELVEMEVSHDGGLGEYLKRIVASNDGKQIMAEFKKLILSSYGKKSEDGRRFIKTDELRQEFESSEAYSTLFMEIVTNADAAAQFVNGIIPSGLATDADRIAKAAAGQVELNVDSEVRPQKLTSAEIAAMDSDELKSGIASGKYIL
jgi:hypothetical protein